MTSLKRLNIIIASTNVLKLCLYIGGKKMGQKKTLVFVVAIVLVCMLSVVQLTACDTDEKEFNEIVSCAKTLEAEFYNCSNFQITGDCGYKEFDGNSGNGTYVGGTYVFIPFKMTSLEFGEVYSDIAFFCNGKYIGAKSLYPSQKNPSARFLKAVDIYWIKDFDKTLSPNELNKALGW